MIYSQYTFICDNCGSEKKSEFSNLPEDWTQGHWKTENGLAWSPSFQLCPNCWYKPVKQNLDGWKDTFKKLLPRWASRPQRITDGGNLADK